MKLVFERSSAGALALAGLLAAGCGGAPPSVPTSTESTSLRRVDPKSGATPHVSAAGATLQYYGGPVIPNPKIYVVWWGNPANINSSITAAHGGIADFFAGVTNSRFVDWLNEYDTNINAQVGSHAGSAGTNQLIGRGNYVASLTLTNIPSGNVTDAQIQSTLDQAFTAGTLPQPDENTIYAIYFPPGVSISLDGSSSCVSFGAYHEAIIETQRHNAFYLVMPDCGDSFSGVTSVSSHELVEAMTDAIPTPGSNPDYPQAWNDSSGSESADLCQSSSGTVSTPNGTFTVQGIWDEKSQSCKTFRNDSQDFNVGISPNVASFTAGTAQNFTVQTSVVAGTAETLTLSVVAPAGVTATVSPTSITAGQTATLTVTTSSSTPNNSQVVVRATATFNGAAQIHAASLLVQTSGTTANDFSLSLNPSSATVAAGSSTSITVNTAVISGSAQTVNLAVSGLPSGVTGSFSPASVTAGGSSTLTLSASSSAPASTGTSFTVTGTGASATHTANGSLTVTVTAPPPDGGGLTNGDFETGTLAGWTSAGTAAAATPGHGGTYAARVGSTSPTTDSSIAQTFTAPANATTLSFSYKVVCPDTVTYDWATATLKDNTSGTTTTVLPKTCSNSGNWQSISPVAITAGHSYTLTLSNHDDNYAGDATYTFYDDVTIATGQPPPPPAGLTNGDFSNGLTGWTVAGTCSAVSGGAQCGSTGPTNGDSSLSQTFTVGSAANTLSFTYTSTCPDTVTYDWTTATLKDNVTGTTTTILAKTCGGTASPSVSVTANRGHSVTLTLTNHDDNYSGDATYSKFSNVAVN